MVEIDTTDLDAVSGDIKRAYQTKTRVIVLDEKYGMRRAGVVSKTTGWRPAYLLMHRSSDIGSWDVIGPRDRIIGWETSHGHYVDASGNPVKVARTI